MKMRSIILGLGTRNQKRTALPSQREAARTQSVPLAQPLVEKSKEIRDEESLAQLHKETVLGTSTKTI